jgi:hypothetical protein
LYLQLVYFPVEIITCFDNVLQKLYDREFVDPETDAQTITARAKKKA